jgi:long-chain fatty acid transport protein
MNQKLRHAVAVGLAASITLPITASATNGYFAHGWGTKSKAMAGVATALPQDTLAAATNPAGMALVGTSLDIGVSFFNTSDRGYQANPDFSRDPATGFPTAGFVTPGRYDSDLDWFLIPSFGYNRVLNDQMTIGISVFGNGGLNTKYEDRPVWENFAAAPDQLAWPFPPPTPPGTVAAPNGALFTATNPPMPVTDPTMPPPPNGANINPGGVFTATPPTRVNLEQLFISIPFTYKVNERHSIGIAPIIAYQIFEAKGLQPFRATSVSPNQVSNNGEDSSWGFGVQIGWVGQINEQLTLGASYRSKTYMDEFSDYKGLLAEGGDFDIPAMLNLGIAYKPRKDITVGFDFQRIFYGDVDALANSNNVNIQPCFTNPNQSFCLGGDDGLGFGWKSMNVYKLGAAWDVDPKWTVRGGVSYADDFNEGGESLFNIMAPATIKWHWTLGATYRHSASDEFNLSLAYMPKNEIEDRNPAITGGQSGSIYMEQKDIEISWTHRF